MNITSYETIPNITINASNIGDRAILQAIDTLGADRLCFGSDMPFLLMHVELAKYKAILRDHSHADRDKVLGGNIAKLLNIGEQS